MAEEKIAGVAVDKMSDEQREAATFRNKLQRDLADMEKEQAAAEEVAEKAIKQQ